MQSHAKVVIIGGGMMGVGLAYHLAEEGWKNVLLIEKACVDTPACASDFVISMIK